jgi:2-keto-3-deoxy-L-rhamnonate aldolase RhmA
MLAPAKRLKEKLATAAPVVGLMATDHVWPLLVELCQLSGLDYLVIDREHGPHSDEVVAHVCQTGRLAGFPVLMRLVSCETSIVRRAIDLGPCGLLLPCVETKAQLDMVREAVLMPPRGKRRPGGLGNYWMRNVHYATWRDEFEAHFIVIPQIETRLGVENAALLAADPLVTALGMGPYDLSADLGCCWYPDDPAHKAATRKVKEAADAVGKKVWIGCDAPSLMALGYTFLWVGTVSSVLRTALTAGVSAIGAASARGAGDPAAPPA